MSYWIFDLGKVPMKRSRRQELLKDLLDVLMNTHGEKKG